MSAFDQAKFVRASKAWQKACNKLGVKIIAPFILELDGESLSCLGFLPDFGGEQGMIICPSDEPEFSTDERFIKFAKKKAMFYSFVNISHYIETADDDVFKEAFNDWGYYGAWENCPSWFKGIKGSKALP